jgi:flagellar hook-basal body complex protein FliE
VAIAAIGGIGGALPSLPTSPVNTAKAAEGGGFADKVAQAMDDLQAQHTNADKLARLAATGQLSDPSEYMIAATQASLATELTVAVRNKAVEAFNSIMSMGV